MKSIITSNLIKLVRGHSETAAVDRFRHETCLMIGNWLGKLPMTYGTKQCGIADDDFDLGTLKTEDVHEDITDSIVF